LSLCNDLLYSILQYLTATLVECAASLLFIVATGCQLRTLNSFLLKFELQWQKFDLNSNFIYVLDFQWQQISLALHSWPLAFDYLNHSRQGLPANQVAQPVQPITAAVRASGITPAATI